MFSKKKESICWSYSFWLRSNEDFEKKDVEKEQEDYETDSRESLNSSRVGLVILQEEIYDVNFMNGTHVVTFGGDIYMIQLWLENNLFQVRIVTDGNDGQPPGILAKNEIELKLNTSTWDHFMFICEETKAALKGLVGHLRNPFLPPFKFTR